MKLQVLHQLLVTRKHSDRVVASHEFKAMRFISYVTRDRK